MTEATTYDPRPVPGYSEGLIKAADHDSPTLVVVTYSDSRGTVRNYWFEIAHAEGLTAWYNVHPYRADLDGYPVRWFTHSKPEGWPEDTPAEEGERAARIDARAGLSRYVVRFSPAPEDSAAYQVYDTHDAIYLPGKCNEMEAVRICQNLNEGDEVERAREQADDLERYIVRYRRKSSHQIYDRAATEYVASRANLSEALALADKLNAQDRAAGPEPFDPARFVDVGTVYATASRNAAGTPTQYADEDLADIVESFPLVRDFLRRMRLEGITVRVCEATPDDEEFDNATWVLTVPELGWQIRYFGIVAEVEVKDRNSLATRFHKDLAEVASAAIAARVPSLLRRQAE